MTLRQERAIDLQRRAIEKVLLSKHLDQTGKTEEQKRIHAAVREARRAAHAVHEYSTLSSSMFKGYQG